MAANTMPVTPHELSSVRRRADELRALEELWHPLSEYDGLSPLQEQRQALREGERSYKEKYSTHLNSDAHAACLFRMGAEAGCDQKTSYAAIFILQAWFNRCAETNPHRLLAVIPRSASISLHLEDSKPRRVALAYVVVLRLAIKQNGATLGKFLGQTLKRTASGHSKTDLREGELIVTRAIDFDLNPTTPFDFFELWFHVMETSILDDDSEPMSVPRANLSQGRSSYKEALWQVAGNFLDVSTSDPDVFLSSHSFESIALAAICAAWLILENESFIHIGDQPRRKFPALTVACSLGGYQEHDLLQLACAIKDFTLRPGKVTMARGR